MPRFLPDLLALCLAIAGVSLARRRGVPALWLAAAVVAGLLLVLATALPDIMFEQGAPDGFGAVGVRTRWLALGVLAMAACVQLSAWQRIPRRAGAIAAVLAAAVAWLFVTGIGFWIS